MDNTPVKVAFSTAAADLALICADIEHAENYEVLSEGLTESFTHALSDVVAAVDRRKALLREVEARISAVTKHRDDANAYLKRIEKIKERVTESTKQVVEAHPNLTFCDSLGRALKVIRNPSPKLVLEGAVPFNSGYLKQVTESVIDTAKIKDDLLEGKELPFARLEWGTQIRGLK